MQATVKDYDGIVIGSGQGGKPLALALAAAGLRVDWRK
jgi:choline dehydrogenase-like flavoprotein